MAETFARGIEKLGLGTELEYKGRKIRTVGLFSKNRLEWIVTDIACWMTSVTSFPFYATLGEDGICHIVDQGEFATIFLSADGINKIIDLKKKGKIPKVKNLVCFDPVPPDVKDKTDLNFFYYQNIMELGKKETGVILKNCGPEDLMTVCYTSGTTGVPKGTEIMFGPYRETIASAYQIMMKDNFEPNSTLISYLPLAHLYERTMVNLMIYSGFKEGFFHGVVSELKDDMKECKPHLFSGVPRILCRFYEAVIKEINGYSGIKHKLAFAAIKAKIAHSKATGQVTHWLYDKLVFNKFREEYGGQMKAFLSSSAPLDANITDHLKAFFSCYYTQVYGQTELNSPFTMSHFDDFDSASTGPPMPRYSLKLIDVPEMGYYVTDVINGEPTPRGEMLAKGPISPGYFKEPEKTAAMFDSEGWMHTADIGFITPNGCVKIIDRKKNIFKLQQGEFVAPEKIENILSYSPWVHQVLIHGNSYQNYVIGLVIPQEQTVMKWAEENNFKGSYEEICASKELNQAMLKDLDKLSREKKLVGWEILKKVHIVAKPLTVESGALTHTFKLKRNEVTKMFSDVFDKLYEEPLTSS
eukprot:TRINITY_DN1261_c0_g1_i9.p1 TRINITY_DN1261_c0_g1~~TRINITY_DN1261_c0_g1_i9.p1  ORF type:complete len:583 (-),score=180.63 TRINITY_DN1261_c0_g1_i9:122-1870(-)